MKCPLYEQAIKRSLAVPCEIISIYQWQIQLEDGSFCETRIEVVKGNRFTKGCIGIHLTNPTDYNLECSIERAESEGFERIYVYGGAL